MSDGILSGLRLQHPTNPALNTWVQGVADSYKAMQEALLNLTDDQVQDIVEYWLNEHYQTYDTITGQFKCVCGDTGDRDLHRIRVVLAAVARSNDE